MSVRRERAQTNGWATTSDVDSSAASVTPSRSCSWTSSERAHAWRRINLVLRWSLNDRGAVARRGLNSTATVVSRYAAGASASLRDATNVGVGFNPRHDLAGRRLP